MAQQSPAPKEEEDNPSMLFDELPNDENLLEASPESTPAPKSESATPAPTSRSPSKTKKNALPNDPKKAEPQLIGHLPRAEEDALQTFEELKGNHYQYSTLGRTKETFESMTCDCQFVPNVDESFLACGEGSGCINRLTQVECVESECRCGTHCQNLRMQRREYANIEIVLTEKKGFGLRAGVDIEKDAFIYEYIGDVVSQPSLAKRMRDYAEEGIQHFYFMMLQKDEFIDATKRGGKGRFANHSCNPNCYVAKWTIKEQVRMGIYSKRNIKKDEELTFNYNVDRYGHDAQPCYCGESNCVGVLGGKTQTDVAAMDDLYLDALGITDEVEQLGLKGTKKKKGRKLDEDYVPVLTPLDESEIPKVVQAIRQTQSREVLIKLFNRIKMTKDQAALRQIMRLRGFSLMCNIMDDYMTDSEVSALMLECMSTWPLLQRNKIEDSKIEEPVRQLAQSENGTVRDLADKLLAQWATLEKGYRIPKRVKRNNNSDSGSDVEGDRPSADDLRKWEEMKWLEELRREKIAQELARKRQEERIQEAKRLEIESQHLRSKLRGNFSQHASSRTWTPEPLPEKVREIMERQKEEKEEQKRKKEEKEGRSVWSSFYGHGRGSALNIIEELRLETEKKLAAAEDARLAAEAAAAKTGEKKAHKTHLTDEEKEELKLKKLKKLVGAVVVKCLSKHKDSMTSDDFKKYAKELTEVIAEKEKKSQSYQSGKLDSLSEEKTTKIKKFSKDYIAKILRRLEKSKVPSASTSTPQSDTTIGMERLTTNGTPRLLDYDDDRDGDVTDHFSRRGDPMDIDERYSSSKSSPNSNRPQKRSRWDEGPSSLTPLSPARDPRSRLERSSNGRHYSHSSGTGRSRDR